MNEEENFRNIEISEDGQTVTLADGRKFVAVRGMSCYDCHLNGERVCDLVPCYGDFNNISYLIAYKKCE